MAKQVDIDVEIDERGRVQVHVKGRKGKACLEFVELFEQALGPAGERRYTQEFYESETASARQVQRTKTKR